MPDSIEGWGEPLSASPFVTGEGRRPRIPLNDNESDKYLIWITELTENGDDGFFATIGEVRSSTERPRFARRPIRPPR